MEEAEKAFNQIVKLDKRDETRSMAAHRFRAHMLQCMGQHAQAADVLTKALLPLNGKQLQEQRIECLYLRGVATLPSLTLCPGSCASADLPDSTFVTVQDTSWF